MAKWNALLFSRAAFDGEPCREPMQVRLAGKGVSMARGVQSPEKETGASWSHWE